MQPSTDNDYTIAESLAIMQDACDEGDSILIHWHHGNLARWHEPQSAACWCRPMIAGASDPLDVAEIEARGVCTLGILKK